MKYPDGMTLRPLQSWPREFTHTRRRSPFRAGWSDTIDLLDRELHKLGSYNRNAPSVLQIAMREQDFRLDGMPRAGAIPAHPGVILHVEAAAQGPLSFPCDAFDRWQDNLRAIALALEALRKVDRYGITPGNEQYTGWKAIEATPTVDATTAACDLLARVAWPNERPENRAEWASKIARDAEIGRNTYRKARANAHPDRNGGDQSQWDEVEHAARVLCLT